MENDVSVRGEVGWVVKPDAINGGNGKETCLEVLAYRMARQENHRGRVAACDLQIPRDGVGRVRGPTPGCVVEVLGPRSRAPNGIASVESRHPVPNFAAGLYALFRGELLTV
jgi:hypothetical protein